MVLFLRKDHMDCEMLQLQKLQLQEEAVYPI